MKPFKFLPGTTELDPNCGAAKARRRSRRKATLGSGSRTLNEGSIDARLVSEIGINPNQLKLPLPIKA